MDIINVVSREFEPSIKWSERRNNGGLYDLKGYIRKFLSNLSGNDLISMLSFVLTKEETSQLKNNYYKALNLISSIVNNKDLVSIKKKHVFIKALRNSGLSLKEAKNVGFQFSNDLWKDCLDGKVRNLGGRNPLSNLVVKEINNQMEDISTLSADKMVFLREHEDRDPSQKIPRIRKYKSKILKTVKYRQTTYCEAYRFYKEKNAAKLISYSSFYKYVQNKFKKPYRFTDLCKYCQYGKDISKDIKKFLRENNLNFNRPFNGINLLNYLNDYEEFFPRAQIQGLKSNIENLISIEKHKDFAIRQRAVYNSQRTDVVKLEGKILIEIDYKAQIMLGQGPRQMNEEFYESNKKSVQCLSFGVYYVDKTQETIPFINCIDFDIVSDYKGNKSYDIRRIFRHLMELPEFKAIDKDYWIIWSDCGSNFRNKEMNYFYFTELAEKNKCVNLNFFVEKHG